MKQMFGILISGIHINKLPCCIAVVNPTGKGAVKETTLTSPATVVGNIDSLIAYVPYPANG